LLSNRTRQVFETDAWIAWNPSNAPLIGTSCGRSASKACQRNRHLPGAKLRCECPLSSGPDRPLAIQERLLRVDLTRHATPRGTAGYGGLC
jgi:hypothetical protein